MAKKPSDRTNRVKPPEDLNLTPFIDMITSLMFFLLIFASMIPVVIIDAPLPKVASTAEEIRKAKSIKPEMDVTVWITTSGFTVKGTGVGTRQIGMQPDGAYAYTELHKHLVTVKRQQPTQKDLTLVPADDTVYETMIRTMDIARQMVDGDPGYQPIPPEVANSPEAMQFNHLFPDVSIGGV